MGISAASADWAWRFVGSDGQMCALAPVVFDPANPHGKRTWGSSAKGAIVVAHRGEATFEEMARSAEEAHAVALVVVDHGEEVCIDDVQMCLSSVGVGGFYLFPPALPACLVPSSAAEVLCSGRANLRARIIRR